MNTYAKKSLGQHFLTSKTVVEDLIRAAGITKDDMVLEVGPGKGFITEELVKTAKKVIAVEKDEHLVDFLKNKFAKEIQEGQLTIICQDILLFNYQRYGLAAKSWKLLGAIPYYITGILLRTVLENPARPKTISLIIQKEVAERIIAADSKESLLSLSVKAFGEPKYIQMVPAGVFSPPPKVDSSILTIENISDSMFRGSTSKHWFFKILHAGFAHKRKMLLPSLAEGISPHFSSRRPKDSAERNERKSGGGLKIEKDALVRVFDECKIDQKARPEELGLEEWGCLTKKLKT